MTRYINAGRLLLKKNFKKKKIMTQTNMISKFKPCNLQSYPHKQITAFYPYMLIDIDF